MVAVWDAAQSLVVVTSKGLKRADVEAGDLLAAGRTEQRRLTWSMRPDARPGHPGANAGVRQRCNHHR